MRVEGKFIIIYWKILWYLSIYFNDRGLRGVILYDENGFCFFVLSSLEKEMLFYFLIILEFF